MEISQIEVSVGEVMERLSPDKIPVHLLKECSEQIAPSLCSLFNHSLNIDQIPCEWKSAVTPLHKKDCKGAAENYRPISLLPIFSKVLERCAGNRFYKHLKDGSAYSAWIPAKSFLCNPAFVSLTHSRLVLG